MSRTAAAPLPSTVTAGQLAAVLGVSERSVLARTSDGRLPKSASGIDLRAIIRTGVEALAEQQRDRARPKDGDDDTVPLRLDLATERAALAREQAEHVAMKNKTLRGELVPVAEINAAVIGMIEVSRRALLRVPVKLFPGDLAERKRVAAAIEQALVDLSAERAIANAQPKMKGSQG